MKITKRQLRRIIREASFRGPSRLEGLIKRYNDAGRVAHHYKRRGTIALDGKPPIKIKDAIEKMEHVLNPPANEGALI
jgi:hypothetical protein